MKRSVQEIVELVVFGAIALLIGTGLLWLTGWIFSGLGWLFQGVAGLLWRLLIVLVPIVLVIGLIYWLVNMYIARHRRLMRQLLQNPLQWSVRKALPPNQLPLEQRRNPNSSGRPVSSPFSPRLVCPPTMRHQLRLTLPLWSRRRR